MAAASDESAASEQQASHSPPIVKRARVVVKRHVSARSRGAITAKALRERHAKRLEKGRKLLKRARFAQSPSASSPNGTASPAPEPHAEYDDAAMVDGSTLVIPQHVAALQQSGPEPMRLRTPPSDLHRSATQVLAARDEVNRAADAFTKALSTFVFKGNREDFNVFRMRLETFLEWRGLSSVLEYPPSSPPVGVSAAEFRYQQLTVYHMITQCAPKEVLQALRDSCSHDGFAAWKFLKDRFLGDEKLYVERLEAQLSDSRWSAAESFAVFESRVHSVLSEHALATGCPKQEYEKQSIIMRAIRRGRGESDYLRLNQVHLIHVKMQDSYDGWLSGIREEARHIEDDGDEGAHRKRAAGVGHPVSAQPSMQISAVDARPHASFPPLASRGPSAAAAVACRNWQRSNGQHCAFGSTCKFAHAGPSGGRGASEGGVKKEGGASSMLCHLWSTTSACRFGDRCKFVHAKPSGAGGSVPAPSSAGNRA